MSWERCWRKTAPRGRSPAMYWRNHLGNWLVCSGFRRSRWCRIRWSPSPDRMSDSSWICLSISTAPNWRVVVTGRLLWQHTASLRLGRFSQVFTSIINIHTLFTTSLSSSEKAADESCLLLCANFPYLGVDSVHEGWVGYNPTMSALPYTYEMLRLL